MDNRAIITHAFAELAKGNSAPYVAAMAENFTQRPMGHTQRGDRVFRQGACAARHVRQAVRAI